ncbi:MAG: hypothetical protein EBZ47_09765, partial [Chlamydiae bacterium]|nr:hypothetical protein [Chlamydiota bacterium]
MIFTNTRTRSKHPGAIAIVNYKGGVGKTTTTALLGCYLAERGNKVLLIDIDPQCSLSAALKAENDDISSKENNIYEILQPKQWDKIGKLKITDFIVDLNQQKSSNYPKNLFLIYGSFHLDDLDLELAQQIGRKKEKFKIELFMFLRQLIFKLKEYEYILIDCPPNKMFLTQGLVRASSYYLPVTIPDKLSTFGTPRLVRWINEIKPKEDRPLMAGYLLNCINRSKSGMLRSQSENALVLQKAIAEILSTNEANVIGGGPCLGEIPELDKVARFLSGESWQWPNYLEES